MECEAATTLAESAPLAVANAGFAAIESHRTISTAETVIRGLIYTNSMLLERIKQAVVGEGDEGVTRSPRARLRA